MGRDQRILNIRELYAMYQRGWSLRALGRLLSINGQTISARFKRENYPLEPYRHAIGPKYLAHCFAQGMSQRAIARKLNVSYQAVWRRVQRYRAQGLLPQEAGARRRACT